MKIISTGKYFADIDALACAIAYAELFRLKNIPADAVLEANFNSTITPTVLGWELNYLNSYKSTLNDDFIIVDCSNPEVLPEYIVKDQIIEVWDHRYGYEDNWDRVKLKVVIEDVGACATLIWEEILKSGLSKKITKTSLNLLYTAIFSNTLNFNASITSERDIKAFKQLKNLTELPANWIETYYEESEKMLFTDPFSSIVNDTKVVDFPEKT